MIKKIDEEEDSKTKSANFVEGTNVYILGDFDRTISTNVIPQFVELISAS
jgi:ATP-dependent protease ClpP protease subunit